MVSEKTRRLLEHLARRPGHDEVKADFRALLIEEFGAEIHEVDFERRVPEVRGRIDALIGRTVFEAKSNLDKEWRDVERRMPDYLADREREEGERFIGIASDGLNWSAFELQNRTLVRLKTTILRSEDADRFLVWLDGVLALKSSLAPDPEVIRQELGQDSIAYKMASAQMLALWRRISSRPDIDLKRQLWASMLKLVYGRDIDNDALWIQHSFLVIVAKCIALAVLGLKEDDPIHVLSGRAIVQANIYGAVESDFFDWVVADEEGILLVRRIIAHVRRFRLQEVQSDILKVLYESLIDRAERHGLGEYYTPDWLASKVIKNAVSNPAEQKVLDPSCGSGAFLFHAVRNFLREAEEIDFPEADRAEEATRLVAGIDIHPVAVIIARVTYLLALAPVLSLRGGAVNIPVYLGDSMQLSISRMLTDKELTIRVPPPPAGEGRSGEPNGTGGEQLDFPETFCRDPALFDKAIERMRSGSEQDMSRPQIEHAIRRITEQNYKRDTTAEEERAITDLGKTYQTMDKLRREGRDTVWAYVARNLSRPLFFSSSSGWANILVGNPPWVAFRHMSADLQTRFKELAKAERVYVGGKLTTQNDLCALFTVRAASLYLRPGGKLAFVLPLATLTRGQYEKFRTGVFYSVRLRYDETWVMNSDLSPLFPVPACTIFATRRRVGQQLTERIKRRAYSGFLPMRDAPEEIADARLKLTENSGDPTEAKLEGGSAYRLAFKQGATLVPRYLVLVERRQLGRVGADPSMPFVVSRRSTLEKEPWKNLPPVESRVEKEFLRPVLLGESIVPWKVLRSYEGVIPVTAKVEILSSQGALNRGYQGIADWMRDAEKAWEGSRSESTTIPLTEQLDYYGKLSGQFPIAPLRLAYTKSGKNAAACLVQDREAVIDHKLYWAPFADRNEALYLCTIINAETTRERIEQWQSRGQWGARDFDKVIFNLSIPKFDRENMAHATLAALGSEAEAAVAALAIDPESSFQNARRQVRDQLILSGIQERIEKSVAALINAL